jgi:hypothetical protein
VNQSSFVSPPQDFVMEKPRRSTRVEKSIPLIVLGQNPNGLPFMERTLSVCLNMHGCRYPSRHDYAVGSRVTLQVVGLNVPDQKPTTVRAVVRSIHPAASLRELNQVGVELETPANVWGIIPPPTDWQCVGETNTSPDQLAVGVISANDSATRKPSPSEVPIMKPAPNVTEAASLSPSAAASSRPSDQKGPDTPRPQRIVVTSDGLISALHGKLEEEAQKTVQAVASKQLNDSTKKALSSIEEARQSSIRDVQELASKQIETIRLSLKTESTREMAVQWEKVEQISQRLDKQASELSHALATVQEYAEKATREITSQIPAHLKELVAQATSNFEYSVAPIVDRRYEQLLEGMQSATQEVLLKLTARSAEGQSQIQTAVNSALEEFRRETEIHANKALAETKERTVSALSSLEAERRVSSDKQRKALEAEVARSAERATEQFCIGMKALIHRCFVAALDAKEDDHSKATHDGLLKDEKKALEDAHS